LGLLGSGDIHDFDASNLYLRRTKEHLMLFGEHRAAPAAAPVCLELDRLADAWQKDARLLKKQLRTHYAGLPRGRVTRPDKAYLILHGGDSPIDTWEEALIRSFKIRGYKVKPIFDEHEQQLPCDVKAVTRLLGPFETHTEKQQGSPVS
jgi:hypothetical protein